MIGVTKDRTMKPQSLAESIKRHHKAALNQ